MPDITVRVEPSNGRSPRRVVKLLCGGVEHVDTIDPMSGFERDRLLDRASQRFAQPRHLLACLHDSIVKAAQQADSAAPEKIAFPGYRLAELKAMDLTVRYYIENVMAQNQPLVVAGAKKTLKTNLLPDLGISLATEPPFASAVIASLLPGQASGLVNTVPAFPGSARYPAQRSLPIVARQRKASRQSRKRPLQAE